MGVKRFTSGQMTLELACALPVLIAVAVIATNALVFFADCAAFDRAAHEAVRVHATSRGYGIGADQACPLIEEAIAHTVERANADISVTCSPAGTGFESYTATITYHPTLFGMGLRSEVFGVALPRLHHEMTYVVDPFKPGVVV